jgi:hypothetical protein
LTKKQERKVNNVTGGCSEESSVSVCNFLLGLAIIKLKKVKERESSGKHEQSWIAGKPNLLV